MSPFCRPLLVLGLVATGACATARPCAAPSPQAAARRTSAWRAQLSQQVQALASAQDANLHLGIHVVSAQDGEALWALHEGERFVPASTVKVLTAAAALDVLGPAYRFATQLFVENFDAATGAARTLILRGSGDPSLDVGDLASLAVALRQAGVLSVTSELVLDDTDFDATPWAQGWMWDDLAEGYSAPVWGLNVAGNAVAVWLTPGPSRGAPVRTVSVPEAPGYALWRNTAITGPARSPSSLKINVVEDGLARVGPTPAGQAVAQGPAAMALPVGGQVEMSGSMAVDGGARLRAFAVRDPVAWTALLWRQALRQAGIAAPVGVRRGAVSASATPMASHQSAPLAQLLPQYVKASNNHGMECVLKRMGAAAFGGAGSFATGTQAVRRYLSERIGVDVGALNVVDGSGASRYDLLTPKQLTAVVCDAARRFATGPELISALPVAGLDGTLARRLAQTPLRGRVRAKTGTMTGISALTGLLQTQDDEVLCFAMMMDGALLPADAMRRLQDDILGLLYAAPPR